MLWARGNARVGRLRRSPARTCCVKCKWPGARRGATPATRVTNATNRRAPQTPPASTLSRNRDVTDRRRRRRRHRRRRRKPEERQTTLLVERLAARRQRTRRAGDGRRRTASSNACSASIACRRGQRATKRPRRRRNDLQRCVDARCRRATRRAAPRVVVVVGGGGGARRLHARRAALAACSVGRGDIARARARAAPHRNSTSTKSSPIGRRHRSHWRCAVRAANAAGGGATHLAVEEVVASQRRSATRARVNHLRRRR